jgi:hypothetical protein
LLGLIGVFGIPKILTAVGDSQTKAILKESLSATIGVVYNSALSGNTSYASDHVAYTSQLLQQLNVVKRCGYADTITPSSCFTTAIPCKPTSVCQEWVASGSLHNGASVAFTASGVAPFNYYILVDANGVLPPNVIGQDQVVAGFKPSGRMQIPGGVVLADSTNMDAVNSAYLTSLFQ